MSESGPHPGRVKYDIASSIGLTITEVPMRIAYLDCASGISGDMLLGAIIDAGVDLTHLQSAIDSMGLPNCRFATCETKRAGFRALDLTVEHEPEHAHRHLHHILAMIDRGSLTVRQKELSTKVFQRLAEAEAKVHGTTVQKVHFHEVGAVDSIADIVGCCVGLDLLNVQRILCSPVPTGGGFVEIAHGRCSVPAPATAELLVGIPVVGSDVMVELTTPTGAAIVASLVDEFGPLPPMSIQRIGYGAGDREIPSQPNILRLLVGEDAGAHVSDQVTLLETNLDDVSGEIIGYCFERLLAAGALDVFTTPIQMKKNRPGVKLTVICQPGHTSSIEQILFQETSTLGIRRWRAERSVLGRETRLVTTSWGQVAGKLVHMPDGEIRFSPEFEACRIIAEANQIPLHTVMRAAIRAAE
jgi:hypothetical protein